MVRTKDTDKSAATYYHYKLIKKMTVPRPALLVFQWAPLLFAVAETFTLSVFSVVYCMIALPVVLWIHYVIARSVLLIAGYPVRKRWRFTLNLPWVGYMPEQYAPYRLFRAAQLHTFWIGFAVTAMFIVWTPPAFTVSLALIHLWILGPRFYILLRFGWRRQDDMLKFGPAEAACYSP
ncbi:hypothetical protein [Paenibacillus glufosinatiresistens]|uniref:hypothetical protein n=1 Tax=Paenibacillus glufosinatiresistens TaxID=3070657 RepID=UPI00286E5501|nr:hypothetical protein [Paenibacillus sp. YX.27]